MEMFHRYFFNPSNSFLILFLIVFIAINAYFASVLLPELVEVLGIPYGLNAFGDAYDKLANNLVAGNGFRFFPETAETLMREPGYPFFLAGVFFVLGYSIESAQIANFILAFFAVCIMVLLVKKVTDDRFVTLLAPILFLFHPAIVVAENRGGFEILFLVLILAFLLSLYLAIEKRKTHLYFLSGIVLGLTTLTKGTTIVFPLFVFFYLYFVEYGRSQFGALIKHIFALSIGLIIAMSPWIIRNYLLVQKVVPTASVLGVSAHAGQYICKNAAWGEGFAMVDRDAAHQRHQLAENAGYSFKRGYYQFFYSS